MITYYLLINKIMSRLINASLTLNNQSIYYNHQPSSMFSDRQRNKTSVKPLKLEQISANEHIVKTSDIKLNDVLINGVKLQCFTNAKNKRVILSRKDHFKGSFLLEQTLQEKQHLEESLFKNLAIRKRMKTNQQNLDQDEEITQLNNQKPQPYNKTSLKISPNITAKSPTEKFKNLNFQNMSLRYYSLLNKQLMMHTTSNRFNPTVKKTSHFHYGRYNPIRSEQIKTKISTIEQHSYNIQNMTLGLNCKQKSQITKQNSKQHIPKIKQETTSKDQHKKSNQKYFKSNNKTRICYSNKFNIQKIKDYLYERKDTRESSKSINNKVTIQTIQTHQL